MIQIDWYVFGLLCIGIGFIW